MLVKVGLLEPVPPPRVKKKEKIDNSPVVGRTHHDKRSDQVSSDAGQDHTSGQDDMITKDDNKDHIINAQDHMIKHTILCTGSHDYLQRMPWADKRYEHYSPALAVVLPTLWPRFRPCFDDYY